MRRTSTVDVLRPDGVDGRLVLHGRGRDLVTDPDGSARVVGEPTVRLEAGHDRVVEAFGGSTDGSALVGRHVGRGFRAAATRGIDPDGVERLLIDDVAIVALLTSYAEIFVGAGPRRDGEPVAGICAGWQEGGVLLTAVRRTGDIPLPRGPEAPVLDRADDELAWHRSSPLPPLGMRRRRRIDVRAIDADIRVDAMFRDTFADPGGIERVVHEYSFVGVVGVVGVVDERRWAFTHARAEPYVLPWVECPAAAASAAQIVGVEIGALREHVDLTFAGIGTCTHLDALLRGLGSAVARSIDIIRPIHIDIS